MKAVLAACVATLVAPGLAQERGAEGKTDRSPRRLESVSWNSNKHELTWVISKGEKKTEDGSYKPLGSNTYVINLSKATMTFNGESRGFSKQEAVNVHAILDVISRYTIESTIWWDQGHGQRPDKAKPGSVRVSNEGPPSLEDALLRIAARLDPH
ncbi:MAG: hypothetical protein AAB225_07435 [Acidobacteriota bacterium]